MCRTRLGSPWRTGPPAWLKEQFGGTDPLLARLPGGPRRDGGAELSQFARQFKARTGRPAHRSLMRLRVEQAARLLCPGSLSIAQVVARHGFFRQEHLDRADPLSRYDTSGSVPRRLNAGRPGASARKRGGGGPGLHGRTGHAP
ncbi:helix-turn-helix domain-containing protein [Streptomyces liliifuscus]|uniref:Helix-turn-helix transcriptional regulator n=1 Tax=Streptomyces liliifuscus TaxID=2797636 RepID=A0A7T7KUM7_9ACTN|nr:helix-turn-helix transcriptional regulator [Streptomyces liliifuscus]